MATARRSRSLCAASRCAEAGEVGTATPGGLEVTFGSTRSVLNGSELAMEDWLGLPVSVSAASSSSSSSSTTFFRSPAKGTNAKISRWAANGWGGGQVGMRAGGRKGSGGSLVVDWDISAHVHAEILGR
eukprot:1190366-Prorocentrum_minimum.AAC.8